MAGKFKTLVDLTVAQFGILAPLIPVGFVVTAVRRPAYALLTGSAVLITCFFAASYVNADIDRYYLGPILMAWTWLAILAGVAAEGAVMLLRGRDAPDAVARRVDADAEPGRAVAPPGGGVEPRGDPAGGAVADRRPTRTSRRSTGAATGGPRSGWSGSSRSSSRTAVVDQLVELLDAALVRPAGRGPST